MASKVMLWYPEKYDVGLFKLVSKALVFSVL